VTGGHLRLSVLSYWYRQPEHCRSGKRLRESPMLIIKDAQITAVAMEKATGVCRWLWACGKRMETNHHLRS